MASNETRAQQPGSLERMVRPMAGHSVIINGTRLFVDYPDAHGEAVVNGRTWRWDFHHYCGPLWLRKDGQPLKNQSPTVKAVWDAFEKWHRRYQRNRSNAKGERLPGSGGGSQRNQSNDQ